MSVIEVTPTNIGMRKFRSYINQRIIYLSYLRTEIKTSPTLALIDEELSQLKALQAYYDKKENHTKISR